MPFVNRDASVVDMRWLEEGRTDDHERYTKIGRDELAAPYISDDELANMMSFDSTVSLEQDTANMIQAHKTGATYISKSLKGEIAKDRLRWLSRRVAVLEGRYPGSPTPKVDTLEQLQALCKEKSLHLDISYRHAQGGWVSNWTDGLYTLPALIDAIVDRIMATDDQHIIKADAPSYIERPPIDSPDVFQQYVAEARLQQQVPLLVGWLGLNNQSTHKDIVEALERHKVKVDAVKIGLVIGFIQRENFPKRWQIYVSLARDLLKQGVYIPFADDVYHVNPNGTVFISKSKYYTATNKAHTVRIRIEPAQKHGNGIETPALVVGADHLVQDQLEQQQLDLRAEAVEAMAEEIYDGWQSKEGWVPWVPNGNSDLQFEARKEARELIGV